ncbi:MAG: GGDEF domain-containing protein [Chloroflexia bacterium]|nr:GGDEF domain-containing protein [Chloroflexia bacterium]
MIKHIQQLEERLAAVRDRGERIDLLNKLAWVLRIVDTKRGARIAQEAYDLARAEEYAKGIADGLISLCEYNFTDFVLALTQALEALAIFEELGDIAGQARACYTLCWAHWSLDNFAEAVEIGQRGLELARSAEDHRLTTDLWNNLGLAYKRSGNYEAGYTAYHQALSLSRAHGDHLTEAKVLTNIALAYVTQSEYEKALAYAEASTYLNIDVAVINGYTLLALGQAFCGLQQREDAIACLEQAMDIGQSHDIAQLSLVALHTRSQICVEQQEFDQAIVLLQQGLAFAEQSGSHLYGARCHETLSQVYEARGEVTQALHHYKAFHRIRETLFNDTKSSRVQSLEIYHRTEMARREAEIYQLRNIELEREIAQRKKTEELLAYQARTDTLTGIANRRHFLCVARHEIDHAQSQGNALALALMDLDHFKQINDQYGHAVGDQALIAFTQTVQKNARTMDLFARLGGDEFALLFPTTTSEQAYHMLQRIVQELDTNPITSGSAQIWITLSGGIAGLITHQETVETLMSRADDALYRAKEAGRRQIQLA